MNMQKGLNFILKNGPGFSEYRFLLAAAHLGVIFGLTACSRSLNCRF
jgi:hypothetical protein